MHSIFHFFKDICTKRQALLSKNSLERFPFDDTLFSCRNAGVFPDFAIKLNREKTQFTGGELIELKDSKSYSIPSFNSTIPSGQKEIERFAHKGGIVYEQMHMAGDDIFALPVRDIFYFVRGRSKNNTKVVLVHGSFFETLPVNKLIAESFAQVIDERMRQTGTVLNDSAKQALSNLFSEQDSFSKVRKVNKASVKLRFRVMTEVTPQGNLLNKKIYPELGDNTLSLLLPSHNEKDDVIAKQRMQIVFGDLLGELNTFKIKHPLNGYFSVYQVNL